MVFYLSGSTRCVVIMPQAFTGNRTVGGELFLCPYHMMVGTDDVGIVTIVAVITDMDGIVVVIRIAVTIGIHRIDGIKVDVMIGHVMLIRRDDLADGFLSRILLKNVRDFLQAPADKDRLLSLVQTAGARIIWRNLLAFNMLRGFRSTRSGSAVQVIGHRVELLHLGSKGLVIRIDYLLLQLVSGIRGGFVCPVPRESPATRGRNRRNALLQRIVVPHLG